MNKEDIKKEEKQELVSLIDQSGIENAVEKIINKNKSLLPQNVAVERIINSAGFYISHRDDLMRMGAKAKLDILYNVLKEAMIGLEAGTDYDIIPFKEKPVVCRKKEGWYKIIDLIKPAEQIRFTNNVVLKGDEYSFNPVTEELTHTPKSTTDSYEGIEGAYAYIKFANGFEKTIFMTKRDIDRIKRISPSATSSFSPWNTMPLKMVKTKAVKELAKELYVLYGGRLNSTLGQIINADETNIKEVDKNGNIVLDKTMYAHEEEPNNEENIPVEENIIVKGNDIEILKTKVSLEDTKNYEAKNQEQINLDDIE